jgi:urea carboxylase
VFDKVLVANRGEIACRVIRTLKKMGVRSVAVYSEADAGSQHVRLADEAVLLGPAPAAQSYLRADKILKACKQTGAQAVHPGYGFLSENTDFAEQCAANGIAFIGPTPDQIKRFGLKHEARAIAADAGVPLVPGTGLLPSIEEAEREATRIGYPVMLKSTAGGGGIGLRVCRDELELHEGWEVVSRLGKTHFAGSGVFLEKYIEHGRHIEVQVFGDGKGHVLALGERDCSTQRRNQKVIEETPAPGISEQTRQALFDAALKLCRAVSYASAGTVEMLLDEKTHDFYFLEVNTRLQVEHGVTEEVTGVDLVEWMIEQAAGELALPEVTPPARGAAIQVRVYAEDPHKGFQPSTGTLTNVALPSGVRCDGFIEAGTEITPYYDPLMVKIIACRATRAETLRALQAALATTRIDGIEGNLEYLRQIIASAPFEKGGITTRYLETFSYAPHTIDVLEAGTQTTVQDYPGRLGYWDVGVPPSGPMDDLAFRTANRLLGNPEGMSALEITLSGPKVVFNCECTIAITGANMHPTLDGAEIPMWQAVPAPKGSTLELSMADERGFRAYLAVAGGFDMPSYLGSQSTFMMGRFGGHGGRALRPGDVLRLKEPRANAHKSDTLLIDSEMNYPEVWEIGVLDGPHSAPDFFTPKDIETIFATTWEVHYNSDRTGVRLIGPKPEWARKDGGEAGLHPSNIHDNAYAIGTVDYTGDMPVILGPDGPSLGGFVCPITITRGERWKMGQLKAGDKLRFVRVTEDTRRITYSGPVGKSERIGVLDELDATGKRPLVRYRRAGDEYLLVEYGPLELDLALRFRVHTLMTEVAARRDGALRGIIDLTPGIRSLQIHYAPNVLSQRELLEELQAIEADLPAIDQIEVPTRVVHLPLSWEDPATLLAIEKYMRLVRKDAPWCPSNIEFIRRINGLPSVEDVKRIVYDASYLVLGLGDVYLGAPVATPTDPRHRLVTTKYNPARTWTAENSVGIGGAYMCIYGMEGPGGYQFVGRTLQVWNTHRLTPEFVQGKPWLLRFFDQIRFYPVSADELLAMRADFAAGKHRVQIEHDTFRFAPYRAFLEENAASIATFRTTQARAFVEERERWAAMGQDVSAALPPDPRTGFEADALPPNAALITSPVAGSLWKVLVELGQDVQKGDQVAIVEAMKTEIVVRATQSGRVIELRAQAGETVTPGQALLMLEKQG